MNAYMNYIALVNSFWDSATTNPLSTGQVSLYFALLHVCNRSNWTEWFQAPNQVLSVLTGLSRSGILKARNELKQRGLIDFRERGTKATIYRIGTIANSTQDSVQDSTQKGVRKGAQDSVQNSNTLYKQKQKLKQKSISNDIPEKSGPYVEDEGLNDALLRYIAHRERMQAALTEDSIRMLITKLNQLAPGDISSQIAILDQSIVNGWKGVFALRERQEERKGITPNRFHNFDQSSTDYDSIAMHRVRARMFGEEDDHGRADGDGLGKIPG